MHNSSPRAPTSSSGNSEQHRTTRALHSSSVLGSGTLADIGVVVTTPDLAHATAVLGRSASMVRMLATPFSLVDLMRAVIAAQQDCVRAAHG